jgi:hypothetical protein
MGMAFPRTEQIDDWVTKGLITREQAKQILGGNMGFVSADKKIETFNIEAKKREPKREFVEPTLNEWLGGVTFSIPVYVVGGDNQRGMKSRIARSGHERRVTLRTMARWHRELVEYADAAMARQRIHVNMIRLNSSRMDTDSLTASMKYVRDAISDWLGVDDSPNSPIVWTVSQNADGKLHGVEVRMSIE